MRNRKTNATLRATRGSSIAGADARLSREGGWHAPAGADAARALDALRARVPPIPGTVAGALRPGRPSHEPRREQSVPEPTRPARQSGRPVGRRSERDDALAHGRRAPRTANCWDRPWSPHFLPASPAGHEAGARDGTTPSPLASARRTRRTHGRRSGQQRSAPGRSVRTDRVLAARAPRALERGHMLPPCDQRVTGL